MSFGKPFFYAASSALLMAGCTDLQVVHQTKTNGRTVQVVQTTTGSLGGTNAAYGFHVLIDGERFDCQGKTGNWRADCKSVLNNIPPLPRPAPVPTAPPRPAPVEEEFKRE